jgi:predicted transcriptional regulator
VVISAAVDREQREALERLAREGDRTLSQQVRVAIREFLGRTHEAEET